jgi:hypothetical protein
MLRAYLITTYLLLFLPPPSSIFHVNNQNGKFLGNFALSVSVVCYKRREGNKNIYLIEILIKKLSLISRNEPLSDFKTTTLSCLLFFLLLAMVVMIVKTNIMSRAQYNLHSAGIPYQRDVIEMKNKIYRFKDY